jgi:hypothetical protein
MRRRSGAGALVGLTVAALLLPGALARAADPTLTVKYRTAAAIYVDGGKAEGLQLGDRLAVVSGADQVAELEIVYLAEHSASCQVVSEKRTVRAGDRVARLPRADEPAAPAPAVIPAPTPTPTPPPPGLGTTPPPLATPKAPLARVRGGVSYGLYRVWDGSEAQFDFQQRTGRADLSAWDIGGRPLLFNLRFRSRQDVRTRGLATRTPTDRRDDRLYELSLRYQPPDEKLAFEVGRIGASNFVGIGYLDGALAEVRIGSSPARVGGFFGRRAELDNLDLDAPGLKYGGFLRLVPGGRYSRGNYEAVVAVAKETADGEVSRDYLSLETRFGSGRRFSFSQYGELDLNRGWRKDLSGSSYQISNLSLAATFRANRSSSFVLSYDGRRNYRYYLNRGVPEDVFDDLLHQGLRASVFASQRQGFSVGAGGGVRLKNDRDPVNAYSANLSLRHQNVFASQISLGVDGVGFQNAYTDGLLATVQAGRAFARGHYVDLSYGRSAYRTKTTSDTRVTEWLRLSGRLQLVRGFYLVGDFEYDRGADLKGPRAFLEAGYQF